MAEEFGILQEGGQRPVTQHEVVVYPEEEFCTLVIRILPYCLITFRTLVVQEQGKRVPAFGGHGIDLFLAFFQTAVVAGVPVQDGYYYGDFGHIPMNRVSRQP